MIAKIWKYELHKDVKGGAAQQNAAYDIALGSSSYILGVSSDASAIEAFELAQRVGNYVGAPDVDPERILQRYASGLVSIDPAAQANELAVHAASAGLARVYHLVYSYKVDDEPDAEMLTLHRDIFRRVLNADPCPSVGADHGDQPNPHHHEAIVAMNPLTAEGVSFGQGWYIEACHIALAICEYQSDLEPEPNRRYVADDRGVYHMLTGLRIADADGQIVKDDDGAVSRKAVVEMQKRHDKIMSCNAAQDPSLAGQPWDTRRVVELIAAPRMQAASTWEELHRSLATVGIRYTTTGTTARLELQGHGKGEADRSTFFDNQIAASAAYANGALGKLSGRLGSFKPAPADLAVRPFVMPRYDPPLDNEKVEAQAFNRQLRTQAVELDRALKEESARARASLQKLKLTKLFNYAGEITARPRQAEQAVVDRILIEVGAKRKRKSKPKKPSTKTKSAEPRFFEEYDPIALFWRAKHRSDKKRAADLRRAEARRAKLKKRYFCIDRDGVVGYYGKSGLAFVEYANIVVVHAADRQAKIDALKLAQAKFGAVRILGSPAWIQEGAQLAAELGIDLHKSQQHIGQAHLKTIASDPDKKLIRPAAVAQPAETVASNDNVVRKPSAYPNFNLKQNADAIEADNATRSGHVSYILDWRYDDLELQTKVEDEQAKGSNAIPIHLYPVHAALDKMDRDTLRLPSSIFDHKGVRYLDDEALVKALKNESHHALRPEIQARLRAIELIQLEQRRWIANALHAGRVSISADQLIASNPKDDWAPNFFAQQRQDPNFLRYLHVMGRRKVDEQAVGARQLDIPPEISVWRREQYAENADKAVIGAIADELYVRMVGEPDRFKAMLKSLRAAPMESYEEAKSLRKSATRFRPHYHDVTPPMPGRGRRRGSAYHGRSPVGRHLK